MAISKTVTPNGEIFYTVKEAQVVIEDLSHGR